MVQSKRILGLVEYCHTVHWYTFTYLNRINRNALEKPSQISNHRTISRLSIDQSNGLATRY